MAGQGRRQRTGWLALLAGGVLSTSALVALAQNPVDAGMPAPAGRGASAPASAATPDCDTAFAGGTRWEILAPGLRLVFAPRGAPAASLRTGRHFALDVALCAATATGAAPVLRGVDADMPAHGHGMNYRTTLSITGPGRYSADGLMLHMPGRWRFLFDVEADGKVTRLVRELEVR